MNDTWFTASEIYIITGPTKFIRETQVITLFIDKLNSKWVFYVQVILEFIVYHVQERDTPQTLCYRFPIKLLCPLTLSQDGLYIHTVVFHIAQNTTHYNDSGGKKQLYFMFDDLT